MELRQSKVNFLFEILTCRVGNDGWASFYQTLPIMNTWRSINMDDMVPHLPPEELGFYHEPQEAWYPKNTTTWVVCSNTNGEGRRVLDETD